MEVDGMMPNIFAVIMLLNPTICPAPKKDETRNSIHERYQRRESTLVDSFTHQ